MPNTILYFHGFKSSSDSGKAQDFRKFIENQTSQTKILIPDLEDSFQEANKQIEDLILTRAREIRASGYIETTN